MQVSEAIQTKRAVRLFRADPVPQDIILAILEAGRQSQSSKNTQPWEFVVIQERATLEALSKTGDYAGHLAGAAFGVVLVTDAGNPFWRGYDLGQTSAYLQLAAWEHGVGSCIASIYHPDQARALLNLPAEKDCQVALSFGYPSPEHKTAKMGGRKPLAEFVHWERAGS